MKTALAMKLKNCEGALERILGRVRQRGFSIAGVDARQSRDGKTFDVRLELQGERNAENLIRQLEKSFSVLAVSFAIEIEREADNRQLPLDLADDDVTLAVA